MEIKEEEKEESSSMDFSSQNETEFFVKDLAKKVKIEIVTISSDIKPELEDSTCLQNEEHILLGVNENIKETEIETKIDIKEEDWWSEREDLCINDDIKDQTHEDFCSTEPPRFFKECVFSYSSDLVSGEDSGNNTTSSMIKDSLKCETDQKCPRQECVVINISSIEGSDGKVVSMASPSKQSKLLQQSHTNKQHINIGSCEPTVSHKYGNSHERNVSEKCFKYLSHIEKHRLVLDNKEANKCVGRDKGLYQLSTVRKSKLTDDVKKTHQCNVCKKAFTQLSHLKRHKLIHEGLKPHGCDICNKSFAELCNLKSHKLIHDGIKPHKCNICHKTFRRLSDLKRHKFIHESIKPHKCNTCTKTFCELSSLRKHKLIHEGIKPHKCNICKKAFTQLSHLKRHKLIHEDIKQHKCNNCNRAFTILSSLKIHKFIHECVKPYKCNICSKAFTELCYLKRHILIHQDK